uniref:G-protein coupled receptors family 3 profile domain-containing protein n=1 Tax=Acrobeloides nanus TaxID=290746 RepID=A0A914DR92_9BILA
MATQLIVNMNVMAQTVDDPGLVASLNQVRQLRLPGDLIIGGVFPVHGKSNQPGQPCGEIFETRGIHRVEAMLYALDMINAQTDFLRGYKLGALILDSCSNPAYALNQSLDFGALILDSCSNPAYALNQSLDFVRDMIGSTDASEYQCLDGSSPMIRHTSKKNVVAVVGASYSSVTVQMANLLRLFRIVQVSPASTNADLSDKNRFEYFARTVPSDNYQARAMIDIASYFNWTYVSLVYSADEYGELGADAFKKEARKQNVCIALEERIVMKKELMMESIDNLVKKLQPYKEVGARVVVLFVGSEYIPLLMEQVTERMPANKSKPQKKIIWLASESWDRNNEAYILGERKRVVDGAIVLMLESQRVPSFEEYYLSLRPGTDKFERNKWLKELWEQKFDCQFNLPEESSLNKCEHMVQSKENFNPDDKVQFVIEAVYAIAHALQAMKQKLCPDDVIEKEWIIRNGKIPEVCAAMRQIDGEDFYKNYLLHVDFLDPFLPIPKRVHFSPQGDGPAHYTILNYQPNNHAEYSDTERGGYREVGKWSEQKLEIYESEFFWNVENGGDGKVPISVCSPDCRLGYKKQLIKSDELCCWACSKCEDYEYLVNETTCQDCGIGRWPLENRTDCYDLATNHLKHMRINEWYSIVPIIFAVLGIMVAISVILVFVLYNETPVVKASGRELSYILLVSMIMCYAMTFILVSPPSTLGCALKRTGIGFAFSCLYSAMLVKTNRIYRIFHQATRTAQRPMCITPISQVFLTGLLAGPQLIGSLIWLLIVPPGTRHDYPTRGDVVLTCNVPDHHFLYSLTYCAVLIVLCTIYAIKTRQVPENFNETKFIGFSMYTTCVVWVSWIFFFFGTGSDFQIQTTSLCISISMSANVALVCIFSPKLWIIFFEKDKNVRKQDGDMFKKSFYSRNSSYRSTMYIHESDGQASREYTALLKDEKERRKISNNNNTVNRKSSSQPSPSITSAAQDTFL